WARSPSRFSSPPRWSAGGIENASAGAGSSGPRAGQQKAAVLRRIAAEHLERLIAVRNRVDRPSAVIERTRRGLMDRHPELHLPESRQVLEGESDPLDRDWLTVDESRLVTPCDPHAARMKVDSSNAGGLERQAVDRAGLDDLEVGHISE